MRIYGVYAVESVFNGFVKENNILKQSVTDLI